MKLKSLCDFWVFNKLVYIPTVNNEYHKKSINAGGQIFSS